MSRRNNILDPQTASQAGYTEPLNAGTANLRTQLTRGQEQWIGLTTDDGSSDMPFPGAVIGEGPTGGASDFLRYRNGDIVPVRIRELFMRITAAGAVAGQILWALRIGSNLLATGFIHSGTTGGNVLSFDLGEGFLVLPGQTVRMEAVAQIAVPAAFIVRAAFTGTREVNYNKSAVPSDPAAEAALYRKLETAIESSDSYATASVLASENLRRRWWAFANGAGVTDSGVGTLPNVYGLGAVDLTAGDPVQTGFQNEQTGPFLLEALYFFVDPDHASGGGFQINSLQIGNSNYVATGAGPLRSDVMRVGTFPGGTAPAPNGQLVIPYVLNVPIWCTTNRALRIVLQEAAGLAPGFVWITYAGTLFGNPQR